MIKQSTFVTFMAAAGIALLGAQAAHADIVKIDGSSTVYPITEAVAEEFQKAKKNTVKVTVGISGTGGGFKKFCRGETDFSNASRPITAKEMEDCKAAGVSYIEMPVAYDALTVVINPKNTFLKQATVAELKTLWEPAAQGKVMKWNQVNPAWPDAPVKLFGAGADSGTFEYFTEAIVGKAKVRVFYQIWKSPLMTVGGPQIISDAIRLCGGENVFGQLKQMAPTVNVEAVLEADPEAIVATGMGDARPEWLSDWDKWTQMTAVKRGNMFHINPDIMQRHTPRILDGAEQLCAHLDVARSHRPTK